MNKRIQKKKIAGCRQTMYVVLSRDVFISSLDGLLVRRLLRRERRAARNRLRTRRT